MTIKYSTGLRDDLQGLKATVKGAVIGATLAFVDGGASADTITDSGEGFIDAGFAPGDVLFVQGCTTAANDTALTGAVLTAVAAGTLTIATGLVDTAEVGAAGTVVACAKGGSLKDILKDGVIKIYSGSAPSDADQAMTGTLLLTLTVSSGAFTAGSFTNGLEFEDDPTDGEIEKSSSETWSGVAVASGTMGYYVHFANATDAAAASTTLPRIMGTVGTSNADMIVPSTTIISGRTYTLDSYKITLPAYYGASV